MASAQKTEVLNLNLWNASDKPKRADFVHDNEQLEALVGGHIADDDLHLNAARLLWVDDPIKVVAYEGTGRTQKNIALNFDPRIVLVVPVDMPLTLAATGGVKLYGALWLGEDAATRSIEVSEQHVFLTQQSGMTGGMQACLNEEGKQYLLLAVR